MKPHQITAAASPRKRRRRVGRGEGSGKGKTTGRGTLGQGARSGGNAYPGFEGGQTRLLMRFPSRRGFTNHRFKRNYQPVNVGLLNVFPEGTVVGPDELKNQGLIEPGLFKILADGDLDRALTVRAPKFSAAARAKIESAGGSVEELSA
ncbi:MAG: 50S ribosomal protein L15 [Chloroflexi bacterium]|nr:50S ribosomal protein L15 [Chloroflexota bacterium]MCY3958029.1 50S ribosomal protein L15 [Chloroflexota bacterium]